ncbi:hypothetical protein Tco_1500124 [Tanacetum coccineum]
MPVQTERHFATDAEMYEHHQVSTRLKVWELSRQNHWQDDYKSKVRRGIDFEESFWLQFFLLAWKQFDFRLPTAAHKSFPIYQIGRETEAFLNGPLKEEQAPELVRETINLPDVQRLTKGPDLVQAVCYCGTDFWLELTAFQPDHAGILDTRKALLVGIQLPCDKLVSRMSKKQNSSAMYFSKGRVCALSASLVLKTEYQLADMFTKALPEDRFKYLVRRIGMRCLTPAELEVLTNETA